MSPKQKSALKAVLTGLCVVALLWVVACMGLYGIMRRPPEQFGRVMARVPEPYAFFVLPFSTLWRHARAGKLEIGDHAPDFTLEKLDKTGTVQLSSFSAQGRPAVLIFGSYT
ncbi:MAG TPA: hypothetical protein VKV39_00755 [Candidatus Sulfotelmatobacter sp.]|nr:hypothetical protein [Candidatus Sulfotelmatobacter sp.]